MCVLGLLPALAGAGGATAAGATAAAATTLQTVGTIVAIGGSLYSGIAGYNASKEQAAQIAAQKQTEAELTAVKDQRSRQQFQSEIRKQFAEMAGRGVSLDSPTVVLLGQEAAREMSFESQAIRHEGIATQTELTHQQRITKANGTKRLIGGVTGGASSFLKHAPNVWPELLA